VDRLERCERADPTVFGLTADPAGLGDPQGLADRIEAALSELHPPAPV
jgi:hypothetical protein